MHDAAERDIKACVGDWMAGKVKDSHLGKSIAISARLALWLLRKRYLALLKQQMLRLVDLSANRVSHV